MKRLAVAAFVVLLGVGIYFLRESTMSVHRDVPDASHLDVWVSGDTLVAEDPASRLTRSHVELCTAEAVPFSDLIAFEETEAVSGDPPAELPVFRFRLEPGADDPDRAQLRGCLEDLRVRHLRLNVLGQHQVEQGRTTLRSGATPEG